MDVPTSVEDYYHPLTLERVRIMSNNVTESSPLKMHVRSLGILLPTMLILIQHCQVE